MTQALIIWKFAIPPKPLLVAKHTVWVTDCPVIRIEKDELYELIGFNNAQRVYVKDRYSEYSDVDYLHGGWHMIHFEQVY